MDHLIKEIYDLQLLGDYQLELLKLTNNLCLTGINSIETTASA